VAREGGDSSATIGRLANHTAGLPMHFQFFFDDQDDRPPAFEETLARYGNLIDRPDERYVYSNLGYGILGHIIEEISQRPLAEMMRDEIFEPLGMTQSFFAPSKEQLAESAIRYDSSREGLPNYVTDHPAASEAFGSINDLLQFGLWHLSDRNEILRVESRRNMHRPLSSSPAASHYGLGWQLGEEHQGVRNFGHNGSMAGVETYVYLRPAEDVVVAAISNFPSPLVRQAFDGIYRVLGIEKGATAQTATKAPIYAPSALQGQWNGAISTYAGEFEIQMDLLAEADDVLISGEEALTNLSYGEDHVYGQIDVELDVPDATRTPHILLLNLRLRGNRLAGVATARSLPGSRPSNALSYPVELRRKSSG
jgi:CubicO group peptidase (beta-lactamase class C family)